MKKLLKYAGLALIVIGVVIFAIDYFFNIDSNALLLTGLAAVLIGVGGHVWSMKHYE